MKQFLERLRLAIGIVCSRDQSVVQYARREFEMAGYYNKGYEQWLAESIIEQLRVLELFGHSGASAKGATSLYDRLVQFKPLSPLTGMASEWMEVSDGLWQNNRCSSVFREVKNGTLIDYDIDGIALEDELGIRYHGETSRQLIKYPYTPVRLLCKVTPGATQEQMAADCKQIWDEYHAKN